MRELRGLRVTFIAGTLGLGGAERQLYYILHALAAGGARVRLLCLTRGEFWEHRVRDLGISIAWVGERGSRLSRAACVIAAVRRERPEVVQSQHLYTNLYAAAAGHLLRIRDVGAVRNDARSEVAANGALGLLSLRAPRFVVANSRCGARNAVALGRAADRLHVLPNVVDTDHFRPREERRPTGPVRLLAAGIRDQKRIDRFLTIMARLRKESGGQIRGRIVGDGPLLPALKAQASSLGLLPDVVEFTGAVALDAREYQAADVLVLTSDFEGTPNVILEAMSCGIPVVATAVGGVPELIESGTTGFLAGPGDTDSLVTSLQRLIADADLREAIGRRARAHVEEHHAVDRLPRFLADMYDVVLS